MSGLFKSISKIFKSVVRTIIQIAPYALAAAAVVFTGGAALGLGGIFAGGFAGAVGGLVTSLGLSPAIAGALTGAITSSGFGAALGFVTGGKKGMQKGALMGALTGGVLGFANPSMFGIAKVTDAAGNISTTTTTALAKGGANTVTKLGNGFYSSAPKATAASLNALDVPVNLPTAAPVDQLTPKAIEAGGQVFQGVGPSSTNAVANASNLIGMAPAPAAPTAVVPQATAALAQQSATAASVPAAQSNGVVSQLLGGSGGVGGLLNKDTIGAVLQSLGGSDNSSKQEEKAREKLSKFAYGGVYSGNPDAFNLGGNPMPPIPQPRYYYDQATNSVVDRQQPQAAPASAGG